MTQASGNPRFIPMYVQRRVRHSLVYLCLSLALLALAVGLYRGGVRLVHLEASQITLRELPWALTLSLMRMTISYLGCLVFAFTLGLLAALTRFGERIIIPLLDILQSVPVTGFFPAATSFFIAAMGGHRIGIELAAIFLIFTSQAWNMAFSVYESTKTIPQDNLDAATSFGLTGTQRFWKLYAPASTPRLVYNSILSWTNGWFFLVACEIIAYGPIRYYLPGIGSFLAKAAEQNNINLVLWGLLALTTLILTMDILVWRPASLWAERFKQNYSSSPEGLSTGHLRLYNYLGDWLKPIHLDTRKVATTLLHPVIWIFQEILAPLLWDLPVALLTALWTRASALLKPIYQKVGTTLAQSPRIRLALAWSLGLAVGIWAGYSLIFWLKPPWPSIVRQIPLAILASTLRLIVAIIISLCWILPVVLWCWDKPKLRQGLTTLAQIGASLPATALFPLIILVAIRRLGGGMEIATLVLLLNGMQWYILFNLLGGTSIIPADLVEATRALGLTRAQTWKKLVLPAIRPALITGILTAWGGGWNALVVSEYVRYQDQVLTVNGIGALLNDSVYRLGDNRAIMICIAALVGWIILINSLFWRPVYQNAVERYKFES